MTDTWRLLRLSAIAVCTAVSWVLGGNACFTADDTGAASSDTAVVAEHEDFEWIRTARRLTDPEYTLRHAALNDIEALEAVPEHRVLREEIAGPDETLALTLLTERPMTSDQIAKLLVAYIQRHPESQIIATIEYEDSSMPPLTDGPRRKVIVRYGHLREGGELFCIDNGAPEGLVADEGGLYAIPRCDLVPFGNPW